MPLQAAPRMSQQHLERMQRLRAAGIARHGKSPALQVPRRAAADCQLEEGAYIRVGGLGCAAACWRRHIKRVILQWVMSHALQDGP